VPIVVFTGKELSIEEKRLKTVAKSIVLKDVQSPERLLDETALFLHRLVTDLPERKQKMLERLHSSNEVLRGRKVLVVDDDVRLCAHHTAGEPRHGSHRRHERSPSHRADPEQRRYQRRAHGYYDARDGRL